MKNITALAKYHDLHRQKGLTTLAITLLLLVILTLIVLFSTNVAFFEQRTTNNENRARLAEQAAEYSLNLAGEFMKANRNNIISKTPGIGWLSPDAPRWARCSAATMTATHPCMAESNATRRAQLYFYTSTGAVNGVQTVPYTTTTPASIELETSGVGGTAAFAANATVRALLCRIDSSLPTPACAATPVAGNRIAITLIANANLPNESASAQLKQTWATYSQVSPSSAVPLVASGLVKGLGNAQVVVSPNAGGYGIPASMWSPCPIGIGAQPNPIPAAITTACGAAAGGISSVSTCHLGEYLQNTPETQLLTTCATSNNACDCPAINSAGSDFLSGHSGSTKQENYDILDRDGGDGSLPDISFFPDASYGTDKASDNTDDSLFEFIFGVDYEASNVNVGTVLKGNTLQNCPNSLGSNNCAVKALVDDLGATVISNCSALSASSSGLYYVTGSCDLPTQVGSPESFVIVVTNDDDFRLGDIFYGLLFVRSDTNSGDVKITGNSKIFGSLVVQGDVDMAGTIDLVYLDTSVSSDPNTLPKSAKFALVPGSWLDSQSGL